MAFEKTIPVEDILIRNPIEDTEVTGALTLYTEGIDEFVAFITHLLQWQYGRPGLTEESVPIISLLRRIVELTDAISVLLKSRSVDPCEVLLRSLFETSLSLEYLLKEDTNRRSLCYLIDSRETNASYIKKFNPKDSNYGSFRKGFEAGRVFKEVPEFTQEMDAELTTIDAWLNLPQHVQLRAERSRVWGMRARQWYSPFSDETNKDSEGKGKVLKTVEDLATHLSKFDLYVILYKQWSRAVHGSDAVTGNLIAKDGTFHLIALRQPIKAHAVTNLTLHLLDDVVVSLRNYNQKIHGEQYKDMIHKMAIWARNYHTNYAKPINDEKILFEDL